MADRELKAPPGYVRAGNELRDRILALIPEHPEILDMEGPWPLHDIDGFVSSDLQPSLYQASWALAAAKRAYRGVHPCPPRAGSRVDRSFRAVHYPGHGGA